MYTKSNKEKAVILFNVKYYSYHSSFYSKKKWINSLILLMSSSKVEEDYILKLSNPFLLEFHRDKVSSSSLSDSVLDTDDFDSTESSDLTIELVAKPFLKLDKKTKKIESDDEEETSKAKVKIKKKTRAKVDIDDDYDSITDLADNSIASDDVSSLSLERPSKPKSDNPSNTTFISKQKGKYVPNSKKKKGASINNKKNNESKVLIKPDKVSISRPITTQELSELLVISETDIIKTLFFKGISVTMNQLLDLTTAVLVGKEFEVEVNIVREEEETKKVEFIDINDSISEKRPPVVTIMGHVDHGKTSLLDRIRKTQTAKKESGGITQQLGAYSVEVEYKEELRKVVFLDTPGHEAFSGMRSRGIQVTDVAILVVAADDGVRPQTVEAINYIQAAKVPLIVAINKIDKEDANVETIKQELAKYNLISESWGGDTLMVPISAKQGTNIDNLLEMILLIADVEDFSANPETRAQGTILESYIDRTKGPIATLLVQNGTLKLGDFLVAGDSIGKVRGMMNSDGKKITFASPSSPVLIWGLSKPPSAGSSFSVYTDEKEAKLVVQTVQAQNLNTSSVGQNLTETYTISESDIKGKINLIIKTDIQGSVEAIVSNIYKMSHAKVQLRVLYAAPGEITETDVDFAYTSNAVVLAFNTTLASGARKAAKSANIVIKESNVIYDLFDYVQDMIDTIVGPEYDEQPIGVAIVKSIFPLGKSFVAGSLVSEGKLTQQCHIKVVRDGQNIYEGTLDSLKRLKEEVIEVKENTECGIFIKDFDSWNQNDLIKGFNLVQKKRIR